MIRLKRQLKFKKDVNATTPAKAVTERKPAKKAASKKA